MVKNKWKWILATFVGDSTALLLRRVVLVTVGAVSCSVGAVVSAGALLVGDGSFWCGTASTTCVRCGVLR